jgi:hypothetical protein
MIIVVKFPHIELSNGKFYGTKTIVNHYDDNKHPAKVLVRFRHHNGKATVYDESRSGLIRSRSMLNKNKMYHANLETSSILDSRDVSYLSDVHNRQRSHRQRKESMSDIDDRSIHSDDVNIDRNVCMYTRYEHILLLLDSINIITPSC